MHFYRRKLTKETFFALDTSKNALVESRFFAELSVDPIVKTRQGIIFDPAIDHRRILN